MTDGPTLVNCFVLTTPRRYIERMKPATRSLALACAVLAACAPPTLYHKPGASPALIQSTLTSCEVAALREVPRDIRTVFIPAQYSTLPFCNHFGACFPRTTMIQPARTESYDANAALRARVTDQCMAQAGFRPVSLRQCDPDQVRGADLPPDTAQPALGANSCALRLPSGQWRIVTPQ
ncbi:MAG: hypothetical protein COW54_16830 [Rhodobacteraceae bacterium CG17_big_fil_post_rev_8_21_14_2_50_63_15]|nr:hypothetical protein [Roseovarius sp.]PIV77027.1 MAG: hypothetical protein COW54_16830 [Rhodobacteraceae bacterium CG17_big_fil_post_rev_8_21_14_2_50_63_15]